MSRKKIHKSTSQKLKIALVIMILIPMMSGSMILTPKAYSQEDGNPQPSPATVQAWKDYLSNYPAMLTQYNADQSVLRQTAKEVIPSAETDMDAVVSTYPFLQEDFQKVKDEQQKTADYMNENSNQSTDISMRIRVAEDRDNQTNVLFVNKVGRFWCGTRGCPTTVYVDNGTGYKKTGDFIASQGIWISRLDGQVALFFGPPQDADTPEWILKDHKFVISTPPSPDPPTTPHAQAYVGWRESLEKTGQWPPR